MASFLFLMWHFSQQTQVDSTQFVNFFCDHVFRRWDEIATAEGGSDMKLDLLKLFAELSEYCGELENPQQKINAVYELLMVRI